MTTTKEHGTVLPNDSYPYDPNGRGIHGILAFNSVSNETERAAIVQQSNDRGRPIEQTGGNLPGIYIADGVGGWFYIGGWNSVAGSKSLTSLFTTTPINLYVDNINGNDANDGSIGSPLQSLVEAEARLPLVINHRVIIHVLPYDVSVPNVGAYVWPPFRERILREPIVVISENFETVTTGTAQAGTGQLILVTAGGLTDNEYVDTPSFLRITSGLAAGDIRTIQYNTVTDIEPDYPFSDVVASGDTYEILRPVVRYTISDVDERAVFGRGLQSSNMGGNGALIVVNGIIDVDTIGFQIRDLPVIFYGITLNTFSVATPYTYITSNASFRAGVERKGHDYTVGNNQYNFIMNNLFPALCPNPLSLSGWGLNVVGNYAAFQTVGDGFDGFVVTKDRLNFWNIEGDVGDRLPCMAVIRGGSCYRFTYYSSGSSVPTGICSINTLDGGSGTPYISFRAKCNESSTAAIHCQGGTLVLASVKAINEGNGPAVLAYRPYAVIVASRVDATSLGGAGMSAQKGGEIIVSTSGPITGATGDLWTEEGYHAFSELTAGTFFRALTADLVTGKISGWGSFIGRII